MEYKSKGKVLVPVVARMNKKMECELKRIYCGLLWIITMRTSCNRPLNE